MYGLLIQYVDPDATDLKTLVYHTVPEGQNLGKTGMYKHTLRAVRYGMLIAAFYALTKRFDEVQVGFIIEMHALIIGNTHGRAPQLYSDTRVD